jgi:hypothetical protein
MLKICYHAMFKWQPTLLLAGSEQEISALQRAFAQWNCKTVSLVEELRAHADVCLKVIDDLILVPGGDDLESCVTLKGGKALWKVSPFQRERISGLLEGLRDAPHPAHLYLESGTNSIQILCSKDEY